MARDEWKETWDWAREVWGGVGEKGDYSYHTFFRGIASEIAERKGWEELGSSDVWHATYDTVRRLKESGKVKTREELKHGVRDYTGCYGFCI